MIAVWVALSVLAGALITRATWRATTGPRALPAPGGPPEDRGEAVRRVLKHLQRRTIAELEEGSAGVVIGTVREVDGVARLTSPITGTPCLGYHLDIRLAWFEHKGSLTFRQLCDEARCVAIEVADDTGSVLVDPDGLELAITDGPLGRWEPPLPPPILSRIPRGYAGWPVTVEEGVLQPGARILICGIATREPLATDYRDGKTRLVLRASSTFPLVASSDPDLFLAGERPIAPEELRRRNT